MINEAILTRPENEDDVLMRLALTVARRADQLPRAARPSPSADRLSWQQAEEEIFGPAGLVFQLADATR
jgi:hypothetical protein